MSLKNPFLFSMKDGTFGVLAIRIEADGDRDESSKGSVLFWTSEDLLVYQEVGLIQLSDCYIERVTCCYHESGDCYQISWLDETGRTFCGELDMLQSGKGSVTAKEVSTLMALPELGEVQTADMEGAILHNMIEVSPVVAERLQKKTNHPGKYGRDFPG